MDVIEIERENSFIVVDKTKSERLEILVSQGQKGDKGDPGDISSVKVNGVELEKVGGSVNIPVPTKTSDLSNDSDFQNENEVNALIADALSDFTSLRYEIVQQLPQVGENGVIYLIANSGTTPNVYDEYIYINGSFEMIGTTEVDLSQYYTKTETDDLLGEKADASDLSEVATSGDYDDLINQPSIPSKTSDLNNDSGFITNKAGDMVVDSIRSKNMFNKAEETEKAILNEQHVETTNNQWNTSYYIAVNGSTTYTCSSTLQPGVSANGQFIITEFNSSRVYIKETFLSSGLVQTITTDTNTRFVKICYRNDRQEKIQFELGETNTEYAPYQNLDGHETFALKEVKIGTWIDGKPLYRKVIESTTFASSYVLANYIQHIVNLQSIVYRKDYQLLQFVPSRVSESAFTIDYGNFQGLNNVNSTVSINWGSSWQSGYSTMFKKIVFVVEYTKSTD